MIDKLESTTLAAEESRYCFGSVPSVVHPSILAEREKLAITTRRALVVALVGAQCCQRLAEAIADRVWTAQKPMLEALREQQNYHGNSTREHRDAEAAIALIVEGLS